MPIYESLVQSDLLRKLSPVLNAELWDNWILVLILFVKP